MPEELSQKKEREIIKKRDFSLVKQTLKGNEKAFALLVSYYHKKILRLGLSFFKNQTDSEDFVQDVFIKVYTNLKSFKGKSMFSTWLMKIAYTTAINSVKRAKNYSPIDDESIIPDNQGESPEQMQIKRITREVIKEAISELPEKYVICIELYFYYDIPYKEISEITEFPENTIKSHIFRAKKILKQKLEDYYE